MDFLTVVTPDGDSLRHEIKAGGLRIGRSSSNDLVLHDLNVSRLHAEIVRRPEGFYLLDAGGKNGTFLNEQRVGVPELLRTGDRVRVGATTLIFNGTPVSPVEWDDRPMLAGRATTILPAGEIRTPALLDIPIVAEGAAPTPVPASPSERGGAVAGDVSLFIEADRELVFHRPLREILEKIMDLARRAVPFERGLLMLLEGGELVPQVMRVPPDEAGRPLSISRTITDRVIKHHESVLTSDALVDFKGGRSVEGLQIRSVACVPLWNNREVIGLIYVDSRHRTGLFGEENLRLLTHLAHVAAVKIENARLYLQAVAGERMEQELLKASELQNHLLPSESPPITGYTLYGSSVPCRAVGGDYYDYIELTGGRYGIGLGDVAGKGLSAALLMFAFQASLRALSELDLPPDETVGRLNRLLARKIPANRFVTFFYGVLDPARHTISYVNAGHNPPWILRRDGATADRLPQTGRPLGLFDKGTYRAETVELAPGEVLLCYSDGVTEGTNPRGEEFGEERLLGILREARAGSPFEIVRRITAEIESHNAGEARQDDITLVALKRTT